MEKIRIVLDVYQKDIVLNEDGTLSVSGATKVPVVANPMFRLLKDFKNTIDLAGNMISLKKGDLVKLMACDTDDGMEDQSLFQYNEITFWMPNSNVELVSGNLGPDARE